MKELYIIGAGDTGRSILGLIERINQVKEEWQVCGYVDDNPELEGKEVCGIPVVGKTDFLNSTDREVYAVCTVCNGSLKRKLIESIHNPNVRYATLIDPSVAMCKGSSCGEGSFIFSNCSISVFAEIRKHVYISYNSTIGHDTVVEDYCTILPGTNISGKVTVGRETVAGTGTKVIQGKKIAAGCILGAGAVVVKDIEEAGTYVGVPVKKIK